ncbi:hypothetical protein AB5N19_11925 [Seiridium cardinale]
MLQVQRQALGSFVDKSIIRNYSTDVARKASFSGILYQLNQILSFLDIFNTPCATFAHIGLPGRCDATLPSITTIMPNELEPAPSVSYYNNGLSHERITSGAVINTADGRNIRLDVESYGHGTFWRRVTQKLRGLVSGEHKKDG